MIREIAGKIACKRSELNLSLTLLGGQSFRWSFKPEKGNFMGVAYDHVWILRQSDEFLHYKAISTSCTSTPQSCDELLHKYFRLNIDLGNCYEEWKLAHKHFRATAQNFKAVRVLDQEPVENVLSFLCTQNNNIKRISNMIDWLCATYGSKICSYEGSEFFSFPTLENLNKLTLESELRQAKFGYRAKYVANAVKYLEDMGGNNWLRYLGTIPYEKARQELLFVPGVGPKVADCICLMSLNHLQATPVDTHIFQIAKEFYMPNLKKTRSLSRKTYDEIAKLLREIYGTNAGWAQTVLFCSDLKSLHHNS